MTITKLEVDNFKRIKVARIEPDGSPTVIIGGRNQQGKTSLLDAIEAALGGKKHAPEEPIRKGEKKSRIVVETDELTVTRTFTPKGSQLEVKPNEAGAIKMTSPQKVLDGLNSTLTFDPLEFGRMDPKKQTKVLRELAGIDLDHLDEIRKKYETERRDIGRDLDKSKGALAKLPAAKEADPNAMSVSEIVAEIDRREKANGERATKRGDLEALRARDQTTIGRMTTLRERIRELEAELLESRERFDGLQDELDLLETDGKRLAAEVAALPPNEPVAELKAQLKDAENAAGRAAEASRRADLEKEVADYTARYDHLTDQLKACDDNRDQAIIEARYPIKGLEAQDEGVYLNGLPWQQASGAEALAASVAIGLALNPKLKILLIRDASLLDQENLKLVADMAAEAGAQLWLERVSEGDEVSVIIEDGMVKP
jgi:DNA repair exonuclease SbcCD ATPase subunit